MSQSSTRRFVARPVSHEELGEFLRNRRVGLNAESFGLPVPRTRRRTPGLRREDVSSIAGISTAYYTWIEQGRPFDISADVLHAIARALRLSDAETMYIFMLAGKGEALPAPSSLASSEGVLRMVNGFTCGPALVLTPWLDVVGDNAQARELFAFGPESNFASWVFCTRNPAAIRLNSEDISVALVAHLRRNRARAGDKSVFCAVIDHLRTDSQEFRHLWDGYIVDSSPLVDIELERPGRGRVVYQATLMCESMCMNPFVIFMTERTGRTAAGPMELL